MARVKIKFPDEKPLLLTTIPVRISDINYGNHLGNDSVLSIIHEARMQLLAQWDYDELHCGGVALIMADVMIAYKSEAYYGNLLHAEVYVAELEERSFDLLYRLYRREGERTIEVAHAKTGMVTFDYEAKKIVPVGEALKKRLQGVGF